MLSITMCIGPCGMTFGRHPAKPPLRRFNVMWSGTHRFCPSSPSMLAVKPSARRRARWKTRRSISINSIAASSTGHGPPWYLPPSEGGFVQSEGQVTAPLQTSLAGRPILDPIAGLRDAVTACGIVLERHARDRNGSAAAGPPAPAPGGSLQRPTAPDLSSVNWPQLLKSAAPCAIDSRLGLWRSHSRRASSYRQDRTARAGTPGNPYR